MAGLIWFHLIFLVAAPGSLWPGERSAWQVERAVQRQVNTQVRAYWPVAPIAFGKDGIPVYIVSPATVSQECGSDADGCHLVNSAGSPEIFVANRGSAESWSLVLSHEVIETLTDGQMDDRLDGFYEEICDPVEALSYTLDGETVADFVYPSWFAHGAAPYDEMRKVAEALHPYYFGTVPN